MKYFLLLAVISSLFSFQKTTIYLTFDGGPLAESKLINEIILEEKIPITVFVIGKNTQKDLANILMYKENPYIELGNNGYSLITNAKKKKSEPENEMIDDLNKNKEVLGLTNNLVRIPERNIWILSNDNYRLDYKTSYDFLRALNKNKFKVFGWDLELKMTPNNKILNFKQILKNIEKLKNSDLIFKKNHVVIRLHDKVIRNNWDKSNLKKFIDTIRKNDLYSFAYLKKYPQK